MKHRLHDAIKVHAHVSYTADGSCYAESVSIEVPKAEPSWLPTAGTESGASTLRGPQPAQRKRTDDRATVGPPTTATDSPVAKRAEATPVVVASSCDPGGLQRLTLRLYGRARVVPVRTTLQLKREARIHPDCVVVLDAAAPELDPQLAARALGLIAPRAVLVWGATAETRTRLAEQPVTSAWIHVGLETTPRELAELISSML